MIIFYLFIFLVKPQTKRSSAMEMFWWRLERLPWFNCRGASTATAVWIASPNENYMI